MSMSVEGVGSTITQDPVVLFQIEENSSVRIAQEERTRIASITNIMLTQSRE